MHTVKYHLHEQMAEDIRRFGMLFISDSSLYEQFNVNNKEAYKSTSQNRQTKIKETANMTDRSNEGALSYGKKEGDGMLRRGDEKTAEIEGSGPCVVRDGITVMMDEMARATNVSVRKSSTVRFHSGLTMNSKVGTIKTFSHL